MSQKFNYIALLVIIILGVAAGNLLSHWFTTDSTYTETQNTSTKISKKITNQINMTDQDPEKHMEGSKIQEIINEEILIKQRKTDENGIRLAKNCSEWQVAHKDMQTQTSERGMIKHCDYYQQYIKTGELPPSN